MINQKNVLNDVLQENLELRLRLEEAEETLRAIREGEIDSLIISGSDGDQVFTLVGADHTYRMLIEEMNEGALTLAPDGTILYCNRSFAAMMKTPQQEIIGSLFNDLIFPSDQSNFQVDLASDDGITRGEINLSRGDGTPLPVYFSINPMWVEGVQSFSLVITDLSEMKEHAGELRAANQRLRQEIAERRHADAKLCSSEERFNKAFHSSPTMMSIIRLEDGSFLDVNNAWLDAMEYSREEVIGHKSTEMDIWVDQEQQNQIIKPLKYSGKLENLEIKRRTKSGRIITCLSSTETIRLGEDDCLLISLTDITERKRIEKEMSRLESLNLIGEMAASIGHEIRNPMTTIRGFLQMVNERDDNEKFKEYYQLMIEELDRTNSIITEYLSMARDKAVELKPRYLNSIVKTLYPMINADASYLDKQVKLDLQSPRLLLDEKEIRQLIMNLSRNGLEAMQPGGVLTIGARVEGRDTVLYINDQGSGIDPSLLEIIGTPFFTTKENGTGLGLAVCYSIAARHNAQIKVDTGPGGTTFSVRFQLPG